MRQKKILIAEASPEFTEQVSNALWEDYHIRVCHSGTLVKELLEEFRPDVLVMDLALPGVDGISLLKQMPAPPTRPRILLTTCFISHYVEAAIAGLGVDMVMLKPCNVDVLAERIDDLTQGEEMLPTLRLLSRSTVSSMLMDLNISAKRRGFSYLEMGIRQYLKQPGQALTKTIYPEVAKEYHTQPQAVERAIRQAIHESWEKRDDRVWKTYFPTGREGLVPRPTNAEFISRLAERYRDTRQSRERQA